MPSNSKKQKKKSVRLSGDISKNQAPTDNDILDVDSDNDLIDIDVNVYQKEDDHPHPQPPKELEKECCRPVVVINQKKGCCCTCVFEVRLQRWRYIDGSPGLELDGHAELQFASHIDGNIFAYPSILSSSLGLAKRRGSFSKGWRAANVRAGIVTVPCRGSKIIDIMTEMSEGPQKNKGLGSALEGGRPHGVSTVTQQRLVCDEEIEPIIHSVQLEHGGNRGENLKAEVEYRFTQIGGGCCCCEEGALEIISA